jgi:hypothetical protein
MRTKDVTDATLTKTQKNATLTHIIGVGLDPADFEWSEVISDEYYMTSETSYAASQLTHGLRIITSHSETAL